VASAELDPVVKAARREALFAGAMWLVAMIYTVTYCYLHGYGRTLDDLHFVLWFPDWVFWGIVVPWLTCILVSTLFAYRIMGNEPLGPDRQESEPALPDPPEANGG